MNRRSRRAVAARSRPNVAPKPVVAAGVAEVAVVIKGLQIDPPLHSDLIIPSDSNAYRSRLTRGERTADFLDAFTTQTLGVLEARSMRSANVVYRATVSVGETDPRPEVQESFLFTVLHVALHNLLNILARLWTVRDNAVHFEHGFLKSGDSVRSNILHNNLVTAADGASGHDTTFTRAEVEAALKDVEPRDEAAAAEVWAIS
jgi:hypothetical protein